MTINTHYSRQSISELLNTSENILKKSNETIQKSKNLQTKIFNENGISTFSKSAFKAWSTTNIGFSISGIASNCLVNKTIKPINDQLGGHTTYETAAQAIENNSNIPPETLSFPENQIANMNATREKIILCAHKNTPNTSSQSQSGWFTYITGMAFVGAGAIISPISPSLGSTMIGVGMGLMGQAIATSGEETCKNYSNQSSAENIRI